jgi:twitching motility protein PilT
MDNNTAPNNGFTYPDFSTNPAPVADSKPVQTYSATPTPLPNMQPKAPVQPTFELPQAPAPNPSNIVTEDTIGVVRSNLEDIMPSAPQPKALERKPLENNLADPASIQKVIKKETIVPVKETLNTESTFKDLEKKSTNTVVDSAPERTIDQLLKYTIDHNASDLHISVGYPAVVRIDGELAEVNDQIISPQDAEEIIFPILTDEKKELLEVNREIDLAYFYQGDINARFRVNAFYSMKNLSAAFRLIPSRVRTLEELLLPQLYNQFAQLKQGLILVTGPTGHGKSTTLAAIIEQVNRTRFAHIITIEDPIEYVFEGKKSLIDQREMDDDTHSWPIALRSALRQDPDVILVGEMRDYETIASAITLAETGHLVLATLHTNNTSQTIDRIIDVFPENQQPQIRSQLANILEAVIAQRLVPLDKGGRRAVSEIMINNPAVQNLIREGKAHQIDNVIRTSADIGMVSLERSLVSLIREGAISIQRAQEYAVYPEEILRLLKS